MKLNELKSLADQWEKNRKAVKAYGEEFKKLGLEEKASSSLAQKAARLDEAAMKKKTEGLKKVGDVLGQVRAMGKDAFDGLKNSAMGFANGDVKGGIAGIADGIAGIAQGLDLLVPGLGQATAALIKFGAAGANIMVDLAHRIIDENQKVTELRNAFAALGSRFGETGDSMLAHFSDLASELPQTREQIAAMAEPLIESGIQGNKLAQAIRAQSAAMAMLGERGGQAYTTLSGRARETGRVFAYARINVSLQDILRTGLSVDDMAKKMGMSQKQFNTQMQFGSFNARQFGEALDEAMIQKGAKAQASIGTMVSTALAKGQSLIGQLFQYGNKESRSGLDSFGKSLSHFMTLFDQSTASGKMLHDTLHDIFEGVLKKAGTVLTGVRIGFKMLEVVFNEVAIKSVPLYIAFGKLEKQVKKSPPTLRDFKIALAGIGDAAEVAGKSLAFVVNMATKLIALRQAQSHVEGNVGKFLGQNMNMNGLVNHVLAPHATGGVVTGMHNGLATVRAADGEGLASIGRGERIVPANDTSKSGGGMTNHIHIQIAGHEGQSIIELTEEALDLVFERIALKRGFAR